MCVHNNILHIIYKYILMYYLCGPLKRCFLYLTNVQQFITLINFHSVYFQYDLEF